jgi:hypothetical protein
MIKQGDSLNLLKSIPDNSVDAIIILKCKTITDRFICIYVISTLEVKKWKRKKIIK